MGVEPNVPVLPLHLGPHWMLVPTDESPSIDERELIEQARSDPDAFAALYRSYVTRVHSFAYRRSGSYEVAEEVTAATFERAWRGIAGFAWQGGGFEPWLFRIAANEVANYFRRRQRSTTERAQQVLREMARELEDEDPRLVELFRADERNARSVALRAALSTLRPRYEEAINLRYLAGLSPEDAAAAMGCSKGTLAVTLHRALRSLRKAMAVPAATEVDE